MLGAAAGMEGDVKYVGMNHFPPPAGADREHGWSGRRFGPLAPGQIAEGKPPRPIVPPRQSYYVASDPVPFAPIDPWRKQS